MAPKFNWKSAFSHGNRAEKIKNDGVALRNPCVILRSMEKKLDGADKLRAVMTARKISRDTLSHLLNKPTRTVDDWISRKSKKVDGTAEMIAEELLAEMEFPPQLQHLWALLAARYERKYGVPVPKKGERQNSKKRKATK